MPVIANLVRRYADDPRFEWHYVGDWTPDLLGLTRIDGACLSHEMGSHFSR